MRRLFVLYDSGCGLCTWARRWLSRQPAFLELVFIPAGSDWAARLFPDLPRSGQADELVVVGDDGGVYRDARAWIICLYALRDYREWSVRLSQPLLLPLARQAFALLSRRRKDLSRWLDLASEAEMAATLQQVIAPTCPPARPDPDPDPDPTPGACRIESCSGDVANPRGEEPIGLILE